MVDERRVERLLRRIGGDLERLKTFGGDADLLGDEVRLAAIKYHFLTGIERELAAKLARRRLPQPVDS